MSGQLRYSKLAENDLLEIHAYISNHSVRAATRFVALLHRNCLSLLERPGLGVRRDKLRPGLRQWVVREYLILYRIDGKDIQIVRIVHGRRNLKEGGTHSMSPYMPCGLDWSGL